MILKNEQSFNYLFFWPAIKSQLTVARGSSLASAKLKLSTSGSSDAKLKLNSNIIVVVACKSQIVNLKLKLLVSTGRDAN